jgi:hypothetical protein
MDALLKAFTDVVARVHAEGNAGYELSICPPEGAGDDHPLIVLAPGIGVGHVETRFSAEGFDNNCPIETTELCTPAGCTQQDVYEEETTQFCRDRPCGFADAVFCGICGYNTAEDAAPIRFDVQTDETMLLSIKGDLRRRLQEGAPRADTVTLTCIGPEGELMPTTSCEVSAHVQTATGEEITVTTDETHHAVSVVDEGGEWTVIIDSTNIANDDIVLLYVTPHNPLLKAVVIAPFYDPFTETTPEEEKEQYAEEEPEGEPAEVEPAPRSPSPSLPVAADSPHPEPEPEPEPEPDNAVKKLIIVGAFVGIVVAVFLYCLLVKKGICPAFSADGESPYGGTMRSAYE